MSGLNSILEDSYRSPLFSLPHDEERTGAPISKAPAPLVLPSEMCGNAIEMFDRDTERADSEVRYIANHMRLLYRNKEWKAAKTLALQIVKIDAYHGEAIQVLTESLAELGDLDTALKCASAFKSVDCTFRSDRLLASIYYKRGDDAQALRCYIDALAGIENEEPELFDIYKNLGNLYVKIGDFDSAEENYNRAYRLCPSSDVVCVNMGTLEIQRHQLGRAKDRFTQALELNPRNDRAWVGLALLAKEAGDLELAWGNLEKALDINSYNTTAVQLYASWSLNEGCWSKAAEHVSNYLDRFPEDADMAFSLACLYFHLRQWKHAELEVQRVSTLSPERAGLKELRHLITHGQQGAHGD